MKMTLGELGSTPDPLSSALGLRCVLLSVREVIIYSVKVVPSHKRCTLRHSNKREVGGERVSTLSHWDKIKGAGCGEEKAGVFQRGLHI